MANKNPNPELTLEFGMHINTDKEYDKMRERYEAGDPNSNAWPTAVDKRLDDYNPGIVMVDGLTALVATNMYEEESSKRNVWTHLPDGALKNRKDVLVAGGDAAYFFREIEARRSLLEKAIDTLGIFVASGAIGSVAGATIYELDALEQKNHRVTTGAPIDPLIKLQPIEEDPKEEVTPTEDTDNADENIPQKSVYSRRDFIRKGCNIGIYSYVGSSIIVAGVSSLPTHNLDGFQYFSEIGGTLQRIGFGGRNMSEVNGRTALMIEKALFIKDLTGEDTALAMGTSHTYNSNFYLNNPEARRQAIKDLVVQMGSLVVGPLKRERTEYQSTPEERLRFLSLEISRMSLSMVRRPYPKDATKKDWNKQSLQDAVTILDCMEVPSCLAIVEELGLPIVK